MSKHKVGDRVLVKLSGGRIVEATIKAIVEKVCACKYRLAMRPLGYISGRLLMGPTNRVLLPGNTEQQSEDFLVWSQRRAGPDFSCWEDPDTAWAERIRE